MARSERCRRVGWAAAAALALLVAAAPRTEALSFGPIPVIAPSAVTFDGATYDIDAGAITLEVDVPIATPRLLRLTDASIEFRTSATQVVTFALDPTLASPALGVVQPDGSFLIPTLFLVGNDGTSDFDLAVPNVTGQLFVAGGTVLGLTSAFSLEDALGNPIGVGIYAGVPEPGTALLLALGLGGVALGRARKEIAR